MAEGQSALSEGLETLLNQLACWYLASKIGSNHSEWFAITPLAGSLTLQMTFTERQWWGIIPISADSLLAYK